METVQKSLGWLEEGKGEQNRWGEKNEGQKKKKKKKWLITKMEKNEF